MSAYVSVSEATALLKQGEVGVLPTDTVMGLVADAQNKAAVTRLYELKHREQKPGTILAASVEDIVTLGLKKRYVRAVEHYWPNPISVVLPCADKKLEYLHQHKQSLAVRIPADEQLRSLLEQTGPLITSSANIPGQLPATSTKEAEGYFGDEVDFYVPQNERIVTKPSTVIQVIDDTVKVIREGAVIIDEETGAIHDAR